MSNQNFNSYNQNTNSDRQVNSSEDFGESRFENDSSAIDNEKNAEQQVLQGMEAEKKGNLKQAIIHYRQALKYLPESLQSRQLLTTALMKVREQHVEAVGKEEREDNNLESNSPRKKGYTNGLKNNSESNESVSVVPAEIALSTQTNFTNLGLLRPISNNSIKLMPQPANELVPSPAVDTMIEDGVPPESMSAAEVYVSQALAYFDRKQWDKSIAACKEALRVYPEMGTAYKIWGNCLQRMGKSAEAIGIYAKALEEKADMAEIYSNLGSVYAKEKKWQRAIEHYQKSTIINPNNAAPYRNLAKVWDELGEYDRSADCFFRAIDLQPNLLSAENHFSLANNLMAEGNLTRAIASYKSCVELKPNFLNAYARLADALEEDGQSETALFYYEKLAQLQTEKNIPSAKQSRSSQQISSFLKPNVVSRKVILPSKANNRTFALPSADRTNSGSAKPQLQPARQTKSERISACLSAAARQPNSATIRSELGNLYAEDKQYSKAIACYQQAIKLDPKAKYYLKLALIWEQNEPAKANLAYYEAFSLESQKVSAKNHYLLGDKLLQQQESKRAIACYRRAVSIKPDFIEAYWRLGEISLARGNHKAALACYHRALKIDPNRVQSYILLGKAFGHYNNWESALSYYQKALVLEPNRASIYCNLGECLANLQQYDEAAKALRQGISKDPNNWQFYYQLGNVCSQQNLWQEAVGAYEKAVLFNSEDFSMLYHYLGQAHLELQQWQNAVSAFEKAIELDSTLSWSYYGLGNALNELQQWQSAAGQSCP